MKAYTLVEIVVVMAIIIIIAGLGVYGVISYRASVELNAVYSDITSAIKRQRNKANNSVAYNPPNTTPTFVAPDFYSIRFVNGVYDYYICNQASLASIVTCTKDLTTNPTQGSSGVSISSTCSGIGFGLITGDVVKIDDSAFTSSGSYSSNPSSPICTITLAHNMTTLTRTLTIDIAYDLLTF